MRLLSILILAVLAFALYVRLAPSNPDQWHATPTQVDDTDMAGGVVRVLTAPREDFERLDGIIRATPRTEVLAGSVAEGQVTYVTRSRVWGFPDYTTVDYAQGRLRVFGRLRFGQADLGVNAARIDGWLAELRAG
ncbi:DUF1499 domain-containing protein [Pseudaestuariivita sp.]|uniref:DUF1499 domain-containing protein n=1 Tax=Pseudaestuariivita sp. TaxID=2211669 RepID=UPI004059011D